MTHPGKYAPPGWIDAGPLEATIERITNHITALSLDLVIVRGELADATGTDHRVRRMNLRDEIRRLTKQRSVLERHLHSIEDQLAKIRAHNQRGLL